MQARHRNCASGSSLTRDALAGALFQNVAKRSLLARDTQEQAHALLSSSDRGMCSVGTLAWESGPGAPSNNFKKPSPLLDPSEASRPGTGSSPDLESEIPLTGVFERSGGGTGFLSWL
jgi:hypothetical protein